jgi:pyocin large subunit-like protein
MSQNIMCESVNDYANARGDYSSLAYHGAQYHQREYHVDDYITDYQNFIRDAPLIASNLKPNSNGEVSFKHAKLEQYSTI